MKEHNCNCEVCEKACIAAKLQIEQLQKKVYNLTIVLCIALTLAGEQVIKTTASYLESFKAVVPADEEPAKQEQKKQEEHPVQHNTAVTVLFYQPQTIIVFLPQHTFLKSETQEYKPTRPYKMEDELAMEPALTKPTKVDELQITGQPQPAITQAIVQAALGNNASLTLQPRLPLFIGDPYAVFLTPSTLPFDVYSTTLALGNNYGFGEYYGIGWDNGYIPPSVPAPGALGLLTIGSLANRTRK